MKVDRDDLQMFEMGFELYDYGEWVDSIGLSSPYVPKIRSILDEAVELLNKLEKVRVEYQDGTITIKHI